MSRLFVITATAVAFIASFGGVALAANAIDPSDGSLDLAKIIYNAFAGGHYAYAAAIAVILGVALVKRYIGPRVLWLHSDAGGATLALVGSAATALADDLANGSPITFAYLESALAVGIAAAGGYSVLKKLLVEPLLIPLRDKMPAWSQWILNAVLWIFDGPPPPTPVSTQNSTEPTK